MEEENQPKPNENPYLDADGNFKKGNPGGGRPPNSSIPPEQLALKKATKELITEYREKLTEALPLISPVLIAKALEGDLPAIKELNDRVMGKAKETVEMQGGLNIQFADVFNKDADTTQSTGENHTV